MMLVNGYYHTNYFRVVAGHVFQIIIHAETLKPELVPAVYFG